MMSKMPCAICSGIPAVASANTGRDIHFEPPITLLRANHIESSDDIWECPQCDNVYLWHDDTAFTGSGNNDEEVLTRLSREAGAVVRAVLHRGERAAESVDVPALIALDETVRGLVLKSVLAHDRPLARHLVPFFLDAILTHEAKGNSMRERDGVPTWASGFVKSVATGDDAVMVQRELERRPHPRLADLRATLKRTLCSVCRTISPYSKTRTRRHGLAPPLAALIQLRASETLDAWECPECESMFVWERDGESEEGSLTRLMDYASASLRACVRRRGEVSENDREMVFASDGYRSAKIVLAHAARNDRELVRQFLPTIVMRLAVYRPEWLRDFLIDFVREPNDAAMVLDAITESSKAGAMVDAVADHCRTRIGRSR